MIPEQSLEEKQVGQSKCTTPPAKQLFPRRYNVHPIERVTDPDPGARIKVIKERCQTPVQDVYAKVNKYI